jgi:hypothetical protein
MAKKIQPTFDPPSVRLTEGHRRSITNAAIGKRFNPIKAALDKTEDAIGRKLYAQVFPVAERKAAAALADRWRKVDACLRFNVGGYTLLFTLQGGGVPVPVNNAGYCQSLGSISDEVLVNSARAHADAVETYKKQRRDAENALAGLLASASTIKALYTIWPEGQPFYRDIQAPPSTQIAPIIANVNAMLGLSPALATVE